MLGGMRRETGKSVSVYKEASPVRMKEKKEGRKEKES